MLPVPAAHLVLVRVKRAVIILLSIVGVIIGLILGIRCISRPPKEAKLLQKFYVHRSSFERLRDLFQADAGVSRLADWGVETQDGISKPPAGKFSAERYRQYLALLKEGGALGVSRRDDSHSQVNILLWARGFAGDIEHVGICWRTTPPACEVASFDAYYRNHPTGRSCDWVYRHIDQNWYLWTDLWQD